MLSKKTKNAILTTVGFSVVIAITAFVIIFEVEWAKRTVVACEVVFEKDTFVFFWLSGLTLGLIILGLVVLFRRD